VQDDSNYSYPDDYENAFPDRGAGSDSDDDDYAGHGGGSHLNVFLCG